MTSGQLQTCPTGPQPLFMQIFGQNKNFRKVVESVGELPGDIRAFLAGFLGDRDRKRMKLVKKNALRSKKGICLGCIKD